MKNRKRITAVLLILILASGITNAQFFEEEPQQPQQENSSFSENQGYFDGSGPDYSTGPGTVNDPGTGSEPEYGTDDSPGGPPGPMAPIDDWIFLLPLAGLAVGVYFLREKKKKALK